MNTCKYCGTQLNGTEAVCPNCGNSIKNNINQVIEPSTLETAQKQEQNLTPDVNTTNISQQTDATKKRNTTIILVIVLIVVIAIAVLVFGVVLLNQDNDTKNNNEKTENSTEVSTDSRQNVEFAGYNLKIPKDYTYTVGNGILSITNDIKTTTYIIGFDYTNTYEAYKNYIAAKYPSVFQDTIVNVNSREYMVVNYYNQQNNYWLGTFYTKVPNGAVVYTGTVKHSDGTAISILDLQFLDQLIVNSTSANTFTAGNEYDLGTKGAVDFIENPIEKDFTIENKDSEK